MQDAVLLKAQSYTLDKFRAFCQPIAEVAIQIKFRFLNKSYEFFSGGGEKSKSEQRILAELSK